jgi:hypothetical protein
MAGREQEHLPFRQTQQEKFTACIQRTVMSSSLPTGPSDVQLPSAVLVRTWRRQVRLDLACTLNALTTAVMVDSY